jgi:hypothetical protein
MTHHNRTIFDNQWTFPTNSPQPYAQAVITMSKMQSLNDDPSGVRRYDLKGYERGLRVTRHGCTRIAHALKVVGPVDLMIRQIVEAFCMVINRHPKMRALMSKNPAEPMTSYIQPPFTHSTEAEKLVTIIWHRGPHTNECNEDVRKLMENACNETVDRGLQYPYSLTIYAAKLLPHQMEGPLTILLFSDHAFGDGYSGMIALNDLLVNLSLLIKLSQSTVGSHEQTVLNAQLDEQRRQLPLRPSLYDQLVGRPTLRKRCLEKVINVAGRMIMPSEIRKFHPLLPSREDLVDMSSLPFPVNKTYCLLDSGTKANLESALAKCRKENVTLHGAIV